MNNTLLNKIILFTVDTYIDRMKAEGAPIPKVLTDLKIAIVSYKFNNRFTKEEAATVLEFGKDQELKDIIGIEISHLIFILTVIKIWVEIIDKKDRPLLNISDKRLIKGKAEYAMFMLNLKQKDNDSYKEKKEIIDESVKTAEKFMDYHINKLDSNESNNNGSK